MLNRDKLHIELLLQRATQMAEKSVGEALAEEAANCARNNNLDASRRWLVVADILENSGRQFILDAANSVCAVSAELEASMAMSGAIEAYLDFLGGRFETSYRNWRRWHSASYQIDPIPTLWQQARARLEVELQIQQCRFSETLIEPQAARLDGPDGGLPFIVSGGAGRPTAKLAIEELFNERIAAGHVLPDLAKEALAIASAYSQDPRYPSSNGWPKVSDKTIKNLIRASFNAQRARPK